MPISNVTGELREWVGACTDITEHREAERQVQVAQRMKAVGQLAGGVAHEVNNALTGVLGFSHLVLHRMPHGDPSREDLEQILKSGEHAAKVVQQLLAYSRQQLLQPRQLDLAVVVREFQSILLQTLGPDKELALETGGPTWVRADQVQIEQVLLNLALNARDAMSYGGSLTVIVGTAQVQADALPLTAKGVEVAPGAYAVLTLADTGVGMDEAAQARLFEPFYTTKPVGQGTGLGLATVYGIVRQSGGYIWVDSAVGRGTRVQIFLPRFQGAATEPPVSLSAPPQSAQHETLVVVDDEPAVVMFIERLLREAGYEVHTAPSGQAGLDQVERLEGRVDLLISDIVMPGMSGRELADRLAADDSELAVLFMSGYTDDEVARRGLLAAGAAFIQKPMQPDLMLERVRDLLDRSRQAAV